MHFVVESASFYLHGLNAVFLHDYGWYRIDPRGLKAGLRSDFCPPLEALPFAPHVDGEVIYEKLWSEPHPNITHLLKTSTSYLAVLENLAGVNL